MALQPLLSANSKKTYARKADEVRTLIATPPMPIQVESEHWGRAQIVEPRNRWDRDGGKLRDLSRRPCIPEIPQILDL